jgi:hypothetical protein
MSAVFDLNHEKLAADPRFAATARELRPPEDKFMKFLSLIRLSTLALALAALGPRLAWAQDPSSAGPIRAVVPADLKWAESKATPGAQVAVIEGRPNEPVPYILRVKFPRRLQGSGPLASRHRACDGNIGHFQFGDRRQA